MWLMRRVRDETDPASVLLMLSTLMSLEQLFGAPSDDQMALSFPAWGRLHHFAELLKTGTDAVGQYATYWEMGYTILVVAPRAAAACGFVHPIFRRAPRCSVWFWLTEQYWTGRLLEKRSHEAMWTYCYALLSRELGEIESVGETCNDNARCGILDPW